MASFERGDRVRVNDGVFRNFVGVVTDVKGRKLTVSINMLDRVLAIGFDLTQVHKVA
jgi:transcription antitermination factor NusG